MKVRVGRRLNERAISIDDNMEMQRVDWLAKICYCGGVIEHEHRTQQLL